METITFAPRTEGQPKLKFRGSEFSPPPTPIFGLQFSGNHAPSWESQFSVLHLVCVPERNAMAWPKRYMFRCGGHFVRIIIGFGEHVRLEKFGAR